MLKCTYIVLLNDNEDNIPHLINSLKKLNGSFKKEFIIIDDGSKDNSLKIAKSAINDLPKTTIITQTNQGPAISINKATSIASGDYIHFVQGDEILHPDSTTIMIDACIKFGTQVACGQIEETKVEPKSFTQKISLNEKLIIHPLKEILLNKILPLRNIGSSGSLVYYSLIEKAGKADNSIYSQTMSLSLRCAKYSNFVFINDVLSRKRESHLPREIKFEAYNNLRSIYNFASNHPDICAPLFAELLKNLSSETLPIKSKIYYYLRSLYTKSLTLEEILGFYKDEYERLF